MKKIAQSMLGVVAFRSAPSTIEEFNTLAKGDLVLDYADSEAYYRGIAPKVRSKFLDSIATALGHSPKVESEKTVGEGDAAKTVQTFERDTLFLKRIKANGVTDEQLVPLLQAAYDEVGYDLSSTRNTGANKADLEAADFYVNAVASGESTWDRIVGKFESVNPGLQIARESDGSVTREVMGEACKVNRLRVLNERML